MSSATLLSPFVKSCASGLLPVSHCTNHSPYSAPNSSSRTHPSPNFRTILCTIGISFPLTLYTTISPTLVSWKKFRFHKKSKSPRWNAGSMEPERTTTMGDGESAMTERPFHIMNAVERIRAKLRIWARACRGFWRALSIVAVVGFLIGKSASRERSKQYYLKVLG